MEGAYTLVGDYLGRPWVKVASIVTLVIVTTTTTINTLKVYRLALALPLILKTKADRMDQLNQYYRELQQSLEAVQEVASAPVNETGGSSTPYRYPAALEHLPATGVLPIMALIVLIVVLFAICKTVACMRKRVCGCVPTKGKQPILVLKVFYGYRTVSCTLMTLPYEANVIKVDFAPRLATIRPDCCTGGLQLQFESPLSLQVGTAEMPIILPTYTRVPILDRWTIKRAFMADQRPATALCIISANDQVQLPYPTVAEMSHIGANSARPQSPRPFSFA